MRLGLEGQALRVSVLALLSGASCLSGAAQTVPQQTLALAFSAQAVQAQGLTPSGTVIWLGVGRDVQEYALIQSLVPRVGNADALGRAALSLPGPVPVLSIWIAVDYQTGAHVLGSPSADFPVQQGSLDPAALAVGSGSSPDFLSDGADGIHVLLVRPGQGAWIKTLGRGGADDESNPGDSRLRLRLSHMTSLIQGGAAAPGKVSAGDLLFVVHPRTMDVATLSVSAQP
jgi:hypothetical protein